MPLSSVQEEQVKKHLRKHKALRLCFVCGAEGRWAFKEIVALPGYPKESAQDGLRTKSVLIECDGCGAQILLSADRVGLV